MSLEKHQFLPWNLEASALRWQVPQRLLRCIARPLLWFDNGGPDVQQDASVSEGLIRRGLLSSFGSGVWDMVQAVGAAFEP